jgi:hypothetical protein
MRDRVALVVLVAGAVSAVGASSAGGQTNPLPAGLGDGSTVNQVVGNAKQQVNRLTSRAPASRGPASSGDGGHSSGPPAARSQPAAPAVSHSGVARAASSDVHASSAGSAQASGNPGAGTSGAKASGGKAHAASKSAPASAADPTTAPEVGGRAATGASSGDGHSLPFTGSRPLQWLFVGALMGLMGVGLRFTLRRRSTA